ncbi:alpha/beta hydrolase family protein [Streptomyces sp. NPDC018031]|uniref:alpha/beta hydrolase family protein n=1 Tax=Streptomyces sp. NPDC018031 TaxID=3365033 RepID=UPI00379BE067
MNIRQTAIAVALAFTLSVPVAAAGTAAAAPHAGSAAAAPKALPDAADPADRSVPDLRLPSPGGRYAIGRDTLHLTDRGRPDPWVPAAGARELMVDLYYPARPGGGTPAGYMTTEEARLLLESRRLDGVVPAEAVSAVATHGRTGARPLPGKHPLVVLSPGFTVSRHTLTLLAEELASRGYVVAAVDHAYESVGTLFPGGDGGGRMLTCVACTKTKETGMAAVAEGRAKDISFLLDRLTGRKPAWRHANLIDRKRIGAAGHSIGGNSAAQAMATDRRVRAGANMDGTFFAEMPPEGLDGRPFLMLGTDDETHRPGGTDGSWMRAWQRLDGWKGWLTVTGSGHFTFTDLPVFGEQLGLPDPEAPLSGTRSAEITRDYVGAFFDQQLRGIPQPLLTGPTPGNPEVKFNRP